MRHTLRPYLTAGVAIAGATLIAIPPLAPPLRNAQVREIQLTGVDTASSPLGDGVAVVYGPSGVPQPPPQYVDEMAKLYLEPNGFTGTARPGQIPDGLSPFTGVKSLGYGPSLEQDQTVMIQDIQNLIADREVTPENPIVIETFSQSSVTASLIMQKLHDAGVPADDVHFVLTGDVVNPNASFQHVFDFPPGNTHAFTAAQVPWEPATPSDLYPTDIYTFEYDGFADFPRYTTNLLSDLNAILGFFLAHFTYPDLTPEEVSKAFLLPGSESLTGEGLTDYYIIPNENLPIAEPLLLIPGIGKPLYDLLEPDLRILVNLGYGSITDGYNQGPADVPTTFGVFPPASVLEQAPAALAAGWQQGVAAAMNDLQHPVSYQDQIAPLVPFENSFYSFGDLDAPPTSFKDFLDGFLNFVHFPVSDVTLSSSPSDIVDDISRTLAYDNTSYVPLLNMINAEFSSLPAYLSNVFNHELDAGNLLDAILLPMSADTALQPTNLLLGISEPLFAAVGTAANLAELFS
jgi:hypothetical protein